MRRGGGERLGMGAGVGAGVTLVAGGGHSRLTGAGLVSAHVDPVGDQLPQHALLGLDRTVGVEGADGSGRSTQIARLVAWLESRGHATVQVGLKRSSLVSEELARAQQGNVLCRTTLSLFYATDFADQLENVILPAQKSDRYIYTLMVRDLVRGMDEAWLRNLYGVALVPDAVFYLQVSAEGLIQRNFAKSHTLDYWESGMDLGLSRDMFDSFVKYQKLMVERFQYLQSIYGFTIVDGDRAVEVVNRELQHMIDQVLSGKPGGQA